MCVCVRRFLIASKYIIYCLASKQIRVAGTVRYQYISPPESHCSHDGMDAIVGALGPLATSARDLALFCRVMLQYEPWLIEPALLEIPWKQSVVDGAGMPSRLSIAILWDDGVVAPHVPSFVPARASAAAKLP